MGLKFLSYKNPGSTRETFRLGRDLRGNSKNPRTYIIIRNQILTSVVETQTRKYFKNARKSVLCDINIKGI